MLRKAMARISICIPTFNRFRFLKWTLARLQADFPDAKIIVSDNGSTDDTRTVQTRVRYLAQERNVGPFPNMLTALEAATGDYAVYCADDDYLLPAGMAAAVVYLDSHPEVSAYCAPCQVWDEVGQQPYWNAFDLAEPVTFAREQGIELFNFIIQRHIWPEHLVYRLPLPLKARTRAYWAFADVPDILAAGAIHFAPQPFYRNLLTHPVGERTQLGNVQCLTDFDEYRAGLELLAYGLFGEGLAYGARHRIHELIQWFICVRMDLARMMYERAGKASDAQMLKQRLAIASLARDAA